MQNMCVLLGGIIYEKTINALRTERLCRLNLRVRRRGRLVATITYRHHLNSEVTAQSSDYRYAQIYLLKLLLNQEMYLKTPCSKDHIIFVNHNAEWSLPISRIIRCDALHWERNLTTLLDWILIDFCVNVYCVSPCSVAYSDTLKNLNAISIPVLLKSYCFCSMRKRDGGSVHV